MHRRGFNLLELAITLAVLALLLTLGSGAYNGYQQRRQLQLVAEALVRDAQAGREAALAHQRPAFLRVQGGPSNWCWGVSVAAPCDCRNAASACRVAHSQAGQHPPMRLNGDAQVEWQPQRGETTGAVQVELESVGGQRRQVQIQADGRARVCDGPC
ncbi:prepilin-type N-terminal cleavage/methylation domain-containing protein [Inhella inkyongensis]|uniref:Prepilin-type N-terminal cleavage/methylation domain-containing protein n=1 Tax=Inhella inkyongensis TaxID=392593 RepID=A0A840S662_9BURK|nr:prepilin-type N-terminal cleavage/methylation domain-containing protein [Inhella inkyongensis]MBB5205905.1 prepilin-type N-terminal cleavage/methylation domain-containing protein [Inhella inkyongensis]